MKERIIRKNHERIHTEEKPFCCYKCDKKFTQTGTFKIHERIYTDKKSFSSQCVTRLSGNQQHWRHTKESIHWWEETIWQLTTLKIHGRIPIYKKPIISYSMCDKIFRESATLKVLVTFIDSIKFSGTWRNPYWLKTFQMS